MKLSLNGRVDSVDLLERFASGERPKQIAEALGCTAHNVHVMVHRYVHYLGYSTLEQAVADHAAKKIQAAMPLALRSHVEILAAKWKPKR